MTREPNERAIEAATRELHSVRCCDGVGPGACLPGEMGDDENQAIIALRAAVPHLRRTIPNTVEALEALPSGAVVWAGMAVERAEGGWYGLTLGGGERATPRVVEVARALGITEWTVIREGGKDE